MYKVLSVIVKLPYGKSRFTFDGGINKDYSIEWYKRDEETQELTGLDFNEASDLKNYLDKNCKGTFKDNNIDALNENEIPHESMYIISDNEIPKFYPFEDLKMFGVVNSIPFQFEIMGYNRFLETK